jgi:hypothetical protein
MLDTGPLAVPAVFAPHNPIRAAEGSKRVVSEIPLLGSSRKGLIIGKRGLCSLINPSG